MVEAIEQFIKELFTQEKAGVQENKHSSRHDLQWKFQILASCVDILVWTIKDDSGTVDFYGFFSLNINLKHLIKKWLRKTDTCTQPMYIAVWSSHLQNPRHELKNQVECLSDLSKIKRKEYSTEVKFVNIIAIIKKRKVTFLFMRIIYLLFYI